MNKAIYWCFIIPVAVWIYSRAVIINLVGWFKGWRIEPPDWNPFDWR